MNNIENAIQCIRNQQFELQIYCSTSKHMSEEDNEAFEALGLAIKALSMQIPKKFNKSHICNGSESDYIVFNIYECTCPNCGFLFRTLINNQKHCHNCGQKLDWN